MNRISLAAAAAIILIANAFALVHAARNRMGMADAEVTLTEHELGYSSYSRFEDDSGIVLNLNPTLPAYGFSDLDAEWLDTPMLQRLGFDCTVSPESSEAERFYQRQRPRQVYVALEYDGVGWRRWLEAETRGFEEERAKTGIVQGTGDSLKEGSRLVAVDVDLNAGALRSRHPDRAQVIVLPAVVGIRRISVSFKGMKPDKRPPHLSGRLEQIQYSIHIPRPFSEEFRRRANTPSLTYRVKLRNGALLEPWVTGVEFTK